MADAHRVLVVDDEGIIREALQAALEDAGLSVRTAENGRVALQCLDSWRPDVVLLDLMMPVMDGWAFREAQRTRPEHAGIPVIVLSGARGLRESAEAMGAARALPKPFDLDEVIDVVLATLQAEA